MTTFADNPRTEVIPNLSFDAYCKLPGINQTLLKTYGQADGEGGCPALYRYYSERPDRVLKDTTAMREGRLFHKFLLEPKLFKKSTVILDDNKRAELWEAAVLRAGKTRAKFASYRSYAEWLSDFRKEEPEANEPRGFATLATVKAWKGEQIKAGLEIVDHSKLVQFEEMRDAIRDKRDVWDYLAGGRSRDCELTVLATQETKEGSVMQLKARLDFCANSSSDLIDLKTARSCNPIEFAKQCAKIGYDIQAAYYFDVANAAGLDRKRFGFLAVEKEQPYLPVIHWMPERWLQRGRNIYKGILAQVKRSILSNDWPGYESRELIWPSWMDAEMEAFS